MTIIFLFDMLTQISPNLVETQLVTGTIDSLYNCSKLLSDGNLQCNISKLI